MSEHTYHFPARIVERAANTEPPTEDAFVWAAEISSDRLDAYFTHMAESSLRNFASDAAAGVTFLDSHNARNLGYGQSLSGQFQVEGEVSRVISEFYTVPGLRFGSALTYQSTDDFIRAVQARLVRDVSVGFYGGDMICDICGGSFYDWRACIHWPGMEYAVGEQGDKTVIATFEIVDARLAEVSAVYDGATPGAMLMRAQAMAEAGALEPETARRLEVKYRIKLPGVGVSARNWPGTTFTDVGSSANIVITSGWPPEERTNTVDELEQIRAILAELNATGETLPEQVRWLVEENARLAPLADQGQQYRADLIAETLAEGVRAMGEAFPAETYEGIMRRAGIEEIKSLRENFARQASLRFPGGRQSQDNPQPPAASTGSGQAQPQRANHVPRTAHKS